jgi:ABC-type Fe3+/spermidine/putrescine transport system ATPase subunit
MMNSATRTAVTLDHLSLSYGSTQVFYDLGLQIRPSEMMALLGPSGCGKTSVLKIIAGLVQPTRGDVRFNGDSVVSIPAERREVVLVFQKPLLFPHMNVSENIAFGLKMRQTPEREIQRRVTEMLRLVQLEGYDARRPKELSGGQEQRVALARALVTRPRVLLLDEPFSALDEALRMELRILIQTLQTQTGVTTIFVTHDQSEAASISDRIALLLDGKIEQIGAPRDFYLEPKTIAAARFFGWQILSHPSEGSRIAFRPEQARLVVKRSSSAEMLGWNVVIVTVAETGIKSRYRVALPNQEIVEVEMNGETQSGNFYPGAEIALEVLSESVLRFSSVV